MEQQLSQAKMELWKPEVTKTLENGTDIDNSIIHVYKEMSRKSLSQ